MFNDSDLSHITKQIQKDTAEVKALRHQAQHQRDIANQKHQGQDPHSADYYEKEADQLEQKADTLETEIDQLESTKVRVEKRIAELEAQRSQISSDHPEHIANIDRELAQLRGSIAML